MTFLSPMLGDRCSAFDVLTLMLKFIPETSTRGRGRHRIQIETKLAFLSSFNLEAFSLVIVQGVLFLREHYLQLASMMHTRLSFSFLAPFSS